MDATQRILLYDYYGALLTQRQRDCFELRYHQDLSLGEIGSELSISRQGVHDLLTRAESLLENMEEKTGCVRRDLQCRAAARRISALAEEIAAGCDKSDALARQIAELAKGLEE